MMEAWVEATKAKKQLDEAAASLGRWLVDRPEGQDVTLHLLDMLLWTAVLQERLIQAAISAKSEEQ